MCIPSSKEEMAMGWRNSHRYHWLSCCVMLRYFALDRQTPTSPLQDINHAASAIISLAYGGGALWAGTRAGTLWK